MSPSESRAGQNPQRVRIFSSDKFSNAVVEEKWDRVKIVCTQPFNKVCISVNIGVCKDGGL